MLKKIWQRLHGHPIPYHGSLDTKLLRLGRRDFFTIRQACEGVQILGGTGSGKTSGSGRAFSTAYLKAGMGGVVFCAKPDEADLWRKLAKECGREHDLVFFDASGRHRFNFMDYAQMTIARNGFDMNLVYMLSRVGETARSQGGGGGGKEDQYFRDASNQLLAHALPFLRVAYGNIRLADLYRFINEAPTSMAEALDPGFVKRFCGATMFLVGKKAQEGDKEAERVAREYGSYWTAEFPSMGERLRSSIVSTLTSTIYPFNSGKLRTLFATDTTLVPEMSREGLIIVMDLPARAFGAAGIIAQQIFKMLWQLSMERERMSKSTRPVFAWIDECQFFINGQDAEHLSVCRQQRVCNVYLTQDLPTFYDRIGNVHTADSLVNKFGTRIFHSTTDTTTARHAADIIGRVTRYQSSYSVNTTTSTNGGSSLGPVDGSGNGGSGRGQGSTESRSTYQDYDIPPDYFGRELRTGGPANGNRVQAIIVRNGGIFRSSRRNRIKVEFMQ